jgi:hypothetical protein
VSEVSRDDLHDRIRELELLANLSNRYILPILDQMVQNHVAAIIRNAVTADTIYQQEFVKGQTVGLEQASTLATTLLEAAQAELRALIKENEQ